MFKVDIFYCKSIMELQITCNLNLNKEFRLTALCILLTMHEFLNVEYKTYGFFLSFMDLYNTLFNN